MKNLLYTVAFIGIVALLAYTIPEGMKRQEIVDCYKAKEICTKYWDVHQGNCSECKKMQYCEENNLLK